MTVTNFGGKPLSEYKKTQIEIWKEEIEENEKSIAQHLNTLDHSDYLGKLGMFACPLKTTDNCSKRFQKIIELEKLISESKDDRYINKMRHYQNKTPVKKESQWKEYVALIILILCGLIFMSGSNFNEECEKHGYFVVQCN